MNKSYTFSIDVASRCNLKCPSCPQANGRNSTRNELMQPELLDSILKKATGECKISFIYLYDWAEPFLNPELPELINVVNSYDIPCGISSNLHIMRNMERVIANNPANFVISTSGFTQYTYSKMHKGGNIEKVKQNMQLLAEMKKRTNSRTRIEVNYIRYLGNLDELVLMRDFAISLGFAFRQTIAALFPLEKLLVYLSDPIAREEIKKNEKELLDILLFPYEELLSVARLFKRFPCSFLEDQIVINARCEVQLCPLVYDPFRFRIVDFLSESFDAIQQLKRKHEFCKSCIDKGIHTLGLRFGPDLKPAVYKRVAQYYTNAGVNFRKPALSWPNQVVRLFKEYARRSAALQKLSEKDLSKFPPLSRFIGNIFS